MKRYFLVILSAVSIAAEPFFLKSEFENLNTEILRERVAGLSRPGLTHQAKFEQIAHLFFLTEALEWAGRPHEADRRRESVAQYCQVELPVSEVASGYPEYLCAVFHANQSRSGSGWSRFEESRAAMALIERARAKGGVIDADRFYAEGRVMGTLPVGMGLDAKSATLNLQMLDRVAPRHASVKFFLGEIYRAIGNQTAASKYVNEARELSPSNPRLQTWLGNRHFISAPYPGMSSELYPSLFASSSSGLGGRLYMRDPRLFDSDREADLTLWATLTGQFGAEGELVDVATVEGAGLFLKAAWDFGRENFYGLGAGSLFLDGTDLEIEREYAEIAAGNYFFDPFYLKVGWAFRWFSLKRFVSGPITNISAPQSRYSFDSGAFGELGVNGSLIQAKIRGDFPQDGILSNLSYTRWLAEVGVFGNLFGRVSGKAKVVVIHVSEFAPYGSYPRLGGSAVVPGVRYGRFVDKSLGMAWAEVSRPIVSALSLGAFGSVGSVASDAGGLFQSKILAGGGVCATWGSEARGIRAELGVFASEMSFSIRANAGL